MRQMLTLAVCLLMVSGTEALATRITVHECLGASGERTFSDRGQCAAQALRTLSLQVPAYVPPPPASKATSPRRQSSRSTRPSAAPQSYLCESGEQSWYQHAPCSAASAPKTKGKAAPVRQSKVSRTQACSEISRPAAALRRGSERDERAGPYAKATGRDPCR